MSLTLATGKSSWVWERRKKGKIIHCARGCTYREAIGANHCIHQRVINERSADPLPSLVSVLWRMACTWLPLQTQGATETYDTGCPKSHQNRLRLTQNRNESFYKETPHLYIQRRKCYEKYECPGTGGQIWHFLRRVFGLLRASIIGGCIISFVLNWGVGCTLTGAYFLLFFFLNPFS